MHSVRILSRSLPRSISSLAVRSFRFSKPELCQLSLQQLWRPAIFSGYQSFSISRAMLEKEGQVDQELSAKFESELQLEKETRDTKELPPHVKNFLETRSFTLHDTPGQEEFILTRTFGDEKIRITFNITDLQALNEESDQYSEDKALYDEEPADLSTGSQSGGAQSKGTINQGRSEGGNFNVAPEDSIAPADRTELMDDESAADNEDVEPSFPARANITIEKAGINGALQIETIAQDGVIAIENVYYYPDTKLADPNTAEADWSRRAIYTGPQFGSLDEDLQVLLERYLDERGINAELALWVPEYIDFKEQREYIDWLSNMKSFIDA